MSWASLFIGLVKVSNSRKCCLYHGPAVGAFEKEIETGKKEHPGLCRHFSKVFVNHDFKAIESCLKHVINVAMPLLKGKSDRQYIFERTWQHPTTPAQPSDSSRTQVCLCRRVGCVVHHTSQLECRKSCNVILENDVCKIFY